MNEELRRIQALAQQGAQPTLGMLGSLGDRVPHVVIVCPHRYQRGLGAIARGFWSSTHAQRCA